MCKRAFMCICLLNQFHDQCKDDTLRREPLIKRHIHTVVAQLSVHDSRAHEIIPSENDLSVSVSVSVSLSLSLPLSLSLRLGPWWVSSTLYSHVVPAYQARLMRGASGLSCCYVPYCMFDVSWALCSRSILLVKKGAHLQYSTIIRYDCIVRLRMTLHEEWSNRGVELIHKCILTQPIRRNADNHIA